ncbi:MAG: NfeD family protein [Clostridiales bacterium]|jgi:membrane protein implicated in regulation of membrane protease activity|nr:NfeD family protein [Clostridiales bacterium]
MQQILMFFIWLVVMIIFILLEVFSLSLITIWFAIGAGLAMISVLFNASLAIQLTVFIVSSIIALIAISPFVSKFIRKPKIPTNANRLLGMIVTIIDVQDDIAEAKANGQIWRCKLDDDDKKLKIDKKRQPLQKGDKAKVIAIEGIKLIVTPINNDVE